MKKIFFLISSCIVLVINSWSYEINGMYAELVDCRYETNGNTTGYFGYYRGSDNRIYVMFFANNYCEY
ncbi:hypothetical protein OFO10_03680 [Campylobacter sp. VBCF_06 NA8]|uniref:hypothetical protein n=1 Tax=Campylobacter sp. VBCF_06 NA8 TaxID=2983822 RepID=UPI0022E9CEA8|nr:hypothetical protein [Campylobacter sp. VBCF_06 NA8]MDA3046249.1 hypothetical protein [Campylobacter sp. VBCF_06 NA8]